MQAAADPAAGMGEGAPLNVAASDCTAVTATADGGPRNHLRLSHGLPPQTAVAATGAQQQPDPDCSAPEQVTVAAAAAGGGAAARAVVRQALAAAGTEA